MLLGGPVGARVMGPCAHRLVELVLAVAVLEVDVVCPVILAAGRVVVCVDVVAVGRGEIAENFLIHDGNLSLDRALAIADIRLGGMHDGPAAQAVVAEGRELIVGGPSAADVGTVLGGKDPVVVGVVAAGLSTLRSERAARGCVARSNPRIWIIRVVVL